MEEDKPEDVGTNLVPRLRATELIDPKTSKAVMLEDEMDEVKANLIVLADISEKSIKKLSQLAEASQHVDAYEVLAKMLTAAAKVNRETNQVLLGKKELYNDLAKNDDPVVPQQKTITNNNLFMTTTDMIREIKKRDEGFE